MPVVVHVEVSGADPADAGDDVSRAVADTLADDLVGNLPNAQVTVHNVRPDLYLHGIGVKKTPLLDPRVRAHLASAHFMAAPPATAVH